MDFHAHLLPAVDDGARDLETALCMLECIRAQGVEVQAVTPHFYAERDSVDAFLARRAQAFSALREAADRKGWQQPRLLCGAELAFFRGISGAQRLDALCLQDTNLLLLEMPFAAWSEETLDEVERLTRRKTRDGRRIQIVLAHLERYLAFNSEQVLDQLLALPVIVQMNAECFLRPEISGFHPLLARQMRKEQQSLDRLLERGKPLLLGSDCHSLHRRPPNLAQGRAALQKRCGIAALEEIDRLGSALLGLVEGAYS